MGLFHTHLRVDKATTRRAQGQQENLEPRGSEEREGSAKGPGGSLQHPPHQICWKIALCCFSWILRVPLGTTDQHPKFASAVGNWSPCASTGPASSFQRGSCAWRSRSHSLDPALLPRRKQIPGSSRSLLRTISSSGEADSCWRSFAWLRSRRQARETKRASSTSLALFAR